MEKKLIKLSEGLAIYFNKRDVEMFGMKEGDILDLSDIFLVEARFKKLPKSKDMTEDIKEVLR